MDSAKTAEGPGLAHRPNSPTLALRICFACKIFYSWREGYKKYGSCLCQESGDHHTLCSDGPTLFLKTKPTLTPGGFADGDLGVPARYQCSFPACQVIPSAEGHSCPSHCPEMEGETAVRGFCLYQGGEKRMTPLQYSYPTQCWCFSEHIIEHALVCLYVL